MIKKLNIRILSWLVHHANRHTKSDHFYNIKKDLLKKYGKFVQYDVQYIAGKHCYTCDGTGIYWGYSYYNGDQYRTHCNRCDGTGVYKAACWNILERLQFGKYTFHQPWQRSYTKPEITQPVINGYIEHTYTRHGQKALTILYIIFDRKRWWKQWKKDIGFGWRSAWYLPRNWIHAIAHIIKNGRNAYPVNNLKRKVQKISSIFGKNENKGELIFDEDLPF